MRKQKQKPKTRKPYGGFINHSFVWNHGKFQTSEASEMLGKWGVFPRTISKGLCGEKAIKDPTWYWEECAWIWSCEYIGLKKWMSLCCSCRECHSCANPRKCPVPRNPSFSHLRIPSPTVHAPACAVPNAVRGPRFRNRKKSVQCVSFPFFFF